MFCNIFYYNHTVVVSMNMSFHFPFSTHGPSKGREVSHCYRSQCCYGEPTCISRLVQFEVVTVAMQPRFHHRQHLDEVAVGRGCSV